MKRRLLGGDLAKQSSRISRTTAEGTRRMGRSRFGRRFARTLLISDMTCRAVYVNRAFLRGWRTDKKQREIALLSNKYTFLTKLRAGKPGS
jgi:hypothetical protein